MQSRWWKNLLLFTLAVSAVGIGFACASEESSLFQPILPAVLAAILTSMLAYCSRRAILGALLGLVTGFGMALGIMLRLSHEPHWLLNMAVMACMDGLLCVVVGTLAGYAGENRHWDRRLLLPHILFPNILKQTGIGWPLFGAIYGAVGALAYLAYCSYYDPFEAIWWQCVRLIGVSDLWDRVERLVFSYRHIDTFFTNGNYWIVATLVLAGLLAGMVIGAVSRRIGMMNRTVANAFSFGLVGLLLGSSLVASHDSYVEHRYSAALTRSSSMHRRADSSLIDRIQTDPNLLLILNRLHDYKKAHGHYPTSSQLLEAFSGELPKSVEGGGYAYSCFGADWQVFTRSSDGRVVLITPGPNGDMRTAVLRGSLSSFRSLPNEDLPPGAISPMATSVKSLL